MAPYDKKKPVKRTKKKSSATPRKRPARRPGRYK